MKQLWSLLAIALVLGGAPHLAGQQPAPADSARARHTTMRHTTMRHTTARHTTTHTRRHTATRARATARTHARRHTANRAHAMARTHVPAHRTMHARTVARTRATAPALLGRAVPYPPSRAPRVSLARLPNGLITADAARTIALRAVPGGTSVTRYELHTEDGRQVYDVKVITPNRAGNQEVRIDAMSGAVVRTKNVDNPVGTVKSKVGGLVNRVKH